MATGSTSHRSWPAGWPAPGPICWPTPRSWCRFRCTGGDMGAPLQSVGRAGDAFWRDSRDLPVSHDALKRVKATPQQVGLSQSRTGRQCAGRLPGRRRRQGRNRAPACASGRRRSDLRRNRGCLFPRAVAGRRPAGGCAGLRAGCRQRPHAHIVAYQAKSLPRAHASRSKSTQPPIAPTAPGPRTCW